MPATTSRRGRRRRGAELEAQTPLEQMRTHTGGPAAYYINPEGATLREILVTYPNGNDQAKRKFVSRNAEYYQARQKRKGLEYVGPRITAEGAKRVAEILEHNRPDFILFLQEEMAACEEVINHAAMPEVKDGQRRRLAQFRKLLKEAEADFDPDAFVNELNEIAKAQSLASIDPDTAEAFRLLMEPFEQQLQEVGTLAAVEKFGPQSKDRAIDSDDIDDSGSRIDLSEFDGA